MLYASYFRWYCILCKINARNVNVALLGGLMLCKQNTVGTSAQFFVGKVLKIGMECGFREGEGFP